MSAGKPWDAEPWNQQADPAPVAPAVVPLHSVYHRVRNRIAIFSSPGVHAAFVYDALGRSREPGPCVDCAGIGIVDAWQEWEWAAVLVGGDRYMPRRCFDLCEACGEALKSLPIGQRWKRARTKAAVLARCIRALGAAGHVAAVEALRALEVKP